MILKPGETFTTGALAADNAFSIESGVVEISTNGGATKMKFYGPEFDPMNRPDKIVISSGLTVNLYNTTGRNSDTEVIWMPI